jgi:hypothetical protein
VLNELAGMLEEERDFEFEEMCSELGTKTKVGYEGGKMETEAWLNV